MRLPHRAVRRAPVVLLLCGLLGAVAVARVRDGAAAARVPAHRPIEVNLASADEIALLPGIGPSLAKAIVDDREARGPFRDLRDLDRVKGIGPGILARIGPHVAFPAAAAPAYAAR